jgi:hypothetical protein
MSRAIISETKTDNLVIWSIMRHGYSLKTISSFENSPCLISSLISEYMISREF